MEADSKNGAVPIKRSRDTQHKSDTVRYPARQGVSGVGPTHRLVKTAKKAGHTEHTKPRDEKEAPVPKKAARKKASKKKATSKKS